MIYKRQLSKILESIINILHQIHKYNSNTNIFVIDVENKRKKTLLMKKLQYLFIKKEIIINQIKKDIYSHIYYLKNKYNDDLCLGYWEYLFILHSKEYDYYT